MSRATAPSTVHVYFLVVVYLFPYKAVTDLRAAASSQCGFIPLSLNLRTNFGVFACNVSMTYISDDTWSRGFARGVTLTLVAQAKR